MNHPLTLNARKSCHGVIRQKFESEGKLVAWTGCSDRIETFHGTWSVAQKVIAIPGVFTDSCGTIANREKKKKGGGRKRKKESQKMADDEQGKERERGTRFVVWLVPATLQTRGGKTRRPTSRLTTYRRERSCVRARPVHLVTRFACSRVAADPTCSSLNRYRPPRNR